MPVSTLELIAALIVTVLAAAVQGTFGLGFNILAVPIVALIDPSMSPVPQVLVSIPLTAALAVRERHAIDLRAVSWIIVGRFPGAAIGGVILAVATSRASVDVMIGLAVLTAVLILGAGVRLRRTPASQLAAGTTAGVMGTVSSIGGPPVALLFQSDEAPVVRANLAVVFLVGTILTVVARVATSTINALDVGFAAVMFPALVLGFGISNRLRHRLRATVTRWAILSLSAIAAVGVLLRGVSG